VKKIPAYNKLFLMISENITFLAGEEEEGTHFRKNITTFGLDSASSKAKTTLMERPRKLEWHSSDLLKLNKLRSEGEAGEFYVPYMDRHQADIYELLASR
jgi:hypothetical protein